MFFCDLETERILLKNISIDDRDFVFSQFSDRVVNRYLFDAEPLSTMEDADEIINMFLQAEPRTHHRWIIIRKTDQVKMGTCGFHCWNIDKNICDVGYDLKEKYWGKGYMQEALNAIIIFAKSNMEIREINACIYPENMKSVVIAQRLGFQFLGKKKMEYFQGNEYLHHIYTLDCTPV